MNRKFEFAKRNNSRSQIEHEFVADVSQGFYSCNSIDELKIYTQNVAIAYEEKAIKRRSKFAQLVDLNESTITVTRKKTGDGPWLTIKSISN